jgi:hypothetical protein
MKLEPSSLNLKFPPSKFTWRTQRFYILVSALLSLLVIEPPSLVLSIFALLVGTPLFWFTFLKLFPRLSRPPHFFSFIIVLLVIYAVSKFQMLLVNWFALLLGIT